MTSQKQSELYASESLKKLNDQLENAMKVMQQNRDMIIGHYDDMKTQLEISRNKYGPVSEDGILEDNMTKCLAEINKNAATLAPIINAIVKILQSSIHSDAMIRASQNRGGPMLPPGARAQVPMVDELDDD